MAENFSRPNPDELLARVKAEEKQAKRGKLKIFVGYAPGVGKTYTMLEAARLRKKDTDVVVAVVETHGRTDTAALLEGFEIIPRTQIEYRGIKLPEMDLNAVLKRRPQLALVDELAHTNAPGLRHEKRYQDVEELLDAGIDVYSTVNIQHVESVRDIVAQITGVWIRETVPDSVIDNASEIELIDIPPDELLKRLKEGKVYIPEQIQNAVDRFFKKGNLLAFRELTMRTAAKHADERTLDYKKAHDIRGPWPSAERVLVFIGPGSADSRLVRSSRRLAHELGAEWTAVYVETPDSSRLSAGQKDRIVESLRLAQSLGAKTLTLQGDSAARVFLEYAEAHDITKIVLAKPRMRLFGRLWGEAAVNQIIRKSDIDIYMVRIGTKPVEKEKKTDKENRGRRWDYLRGFGVVVLATILAQLLSGLFTPANLVMVYLLCVVITAVLWGFGPSVMVSVIGVIAYDFFFISPTLTFRVSDTQYIFTFVVMLGVGLMISYLMQRIRQQTDASTRRESQTSALYALGRDLATSNDLQSYIHVIVMRAQETFGHEAIVFLPDVRDKETLRPFSQAPEVSVDENESAAAVWAFKHQKIVGHGTDTLPNAKSRYLPLITPRRTVGVLALSAAGGELTVEQERLLEAYADLAAIALESMILSEEAQETKASQDTEKLQTALLNAVSHDLRTPLVSIIGTLSSLQEEGMNLSDSAKTNLIQVAREEAERLNRLITNLLDESRVESGAIRISKQLADVQDLVGAALEQMGSRVGNRAIKIGIPPCLPFLFVDFGLILQTLVNILDNAIKYSPADSPIDINAKEVAGEVHIEIADHGVGVPPEDLARIFDKFYRVQQPDNVKGTGLGLSISKGIIEAHQGCITAENRPGGGTIIKIILPAATDEQNSVEPSHV